jgi:DNA-directed RNA polymerase specialized sigma24 family protein
MPGKPSAPAEGGNLMAMMAEVKAGFIKLSDEDRNILYQKHANSLTYGAIAEELELPSDDAARMRHSRAIKRLITRLGGFRPFLDKDESSQDRQDEPEEKEEEHDDNDTLD